MYKKPEKHEPMSYRPKPQQNHLTLNEFMKVDIPIPSSFSDRQLCDELARRGYTVTKTTGT